MSKQISEERVKEKLKEVENTDVEEFYSEIDGTYSTMFVNGYKCGKKKAFKELLEEN